MKKTEGAILHPLGKKEIYILSEIKRKRKPYSEISDEEKEYRKQWNEDNRTTLCITINKKDKLDFKEACEKLNVTQYSVIKKTVDETIKKAKE